MFVTTEKEAARLGLDVQAVITGWGMYGGRSIYHGVGMVWSMNKAIKSAGLDFLKDIDNFEIHVFAATAMGTMREIKNHGALI